jgi:hypothetical protein
MPIDSHGQVRMVHKENVGKLTERGFTVYFVLDLVYGAWIFIFISLVSCIADIFFFAIFCGEFPRMNKKLLRRQFIRQSR